MKNLKKLFYLIALIAIVIGCEKEVTEELPINSNVEKDFDLESYRNKIESKYFNSKSTSQRLEEEYLCNGSFEDIIEENGGDKSYLFYGVEGAQISIYVQRLISGYDAMFILYFGETYITSRDDSYPSQVGGCYSDPRIDNYPLPSTGVYTLIVGSAAVCDSLPDEYILHISGLNCDSDGDDILDYEDNCPNTPNPDQADMDADGIGDVCDDDNDNDGILDEVDNCVYTYNPDQADNDDDDIGDVCDDDDDNDGILDEIDNCQFTYNPDQADFDGDNIGDVCDDDDDNDGILDEVDNCKFTVNPDQADWDDDGMGDVCDDDDDNDGRIDSKDIYPFSNTASMLNLNCYLNIENQEVKRGKYMNDEIQEVIDMVTALEDVSDAKRTTKFRRKMYIVVNYWWYKYRLISSREKRQILECINQMSYPFNESN